MYFAKLIYKSFMNYMYPKPKRQSISPKLRLDVWSKVNKKSLGVCYCCNDPLHIKNMHVAHDKPHAHGGSIALSNLYPTCMHCNLKCGKRSLRLYKASLKK